MIDWALVLTPLLVLPIALMFRFVGCESFGVDNSPPSYRKFILGEDLTGAIKNPGALPNKANLVAYWRLVDAGDPSTARDENGFQNGDYVKTPEGIAASAASDSAPGDFKTGEPSLIASDTGVPCRLFRGGRVRVPFKPALYTEEFTIEAWVDAQWAPTPGHQHVLFSAGGLFQKRPADPPGYHGFIVYADEDNRWQVILAPSDKVLAAPPLVPRGRRTHLAVTVKREGTQFRATVFIDGKDAGSGLADAYSTPDGQPMFIGVDNENGDVSLPMKPTKPILSRVQEVVLHRKALSREEIENHVDINRSNE